MKTLHALFTANSTRRYPLRRVLFSAPLVLICFALLQGAQAVSPSPDGGYPAATQPRELTPSSTEAAGSGTQL